jgi:hypothetical protein
MGRPSDTHNKKEKGAPREEPQLRRASFPLFYLNLARAENLIEASKV